MPSAYRILGLLSDPQTSSEQYEKMNHIYSETIFLTNLSNQLKLLVDKGLVTKEGHRRGRYSLVTEQSYS